MDNVTEKTKKLIEVIDGSDIVKNLDYYKKRVMSNRSIMILIDRYNNSFDDYEKMDIKRRIYDYEDYGLYMKYYNELFYVIMKINNMYKKFTLDRGCKS